MAVGVMSVLVFGTLMGAVARLILPGRQDLTVSATIVAGLLGAGTVGALMSGAFEGRFDWEGPSVIGSLIGATAFVLLAEVINRRIAARGSDVPVEDLLRDGEGARVEFKSAARYNLHTGDKDARIELAIVRTVAGFANAGGGTLLIGVDDDARPVGLEDDLKLVKGGDLDRYELWLHDLLEHCLGRSALPHVRVRFERVDGADVCRVEVSRADSPVYLRPHSGDQRPQFHVRAGNSTRELGVDDAVDYVVRRWPRGVLPRAGLAARARLARR